MKVYIFLECSTLRALLDVKFHDKKKKIIFPMKTRSCSILERGMIALKGVSFSKIPHTFLCSITWPINSLEYFRPLTLRLREALKSGPTLILRFAWHKFYHITSMWLWEQMVHNKKTFGANFHKILTSKIKRNIQFQILYIQKKCKIFWKKWLDNFIWLHQLGSKRSPWDFPIFNLPRLHKFVEIVKLYN